MPSPAPDVPEQDGEGRPSLQQSSDGAEDDEDVYGDQDDAQSFIQPAMSPVATRLTSPRTPAVERAAAMDDLLPERGPFEAPGDGEAGGFHIIDEASLKNGTTDSSPLSTASEPFAPPRRRTTVGTYPVHQPQGSSMPMPWQAGPKTFLIDEPANSKPASSMSNVFGGPSRVQRSASAGENALKRLSKALPSISIPTGLIPSIPTPSFFSSSSSQKDEPAAQPQKSSPQLMSDRIAARWETTWGYISSGYTTPNPSSPNPGTPLTPAPSAKTPALRKSTSDDSLLYQSLSRVSSFGDDNRFVNVREQVNSRIKAIRDSWDGPSFRLPQFQNLLTTPLKKAATSSAAEPSLNSSRSGSVPNGPRARRDDLPPLDSILESLTGDVVVMGGYRGSVLRSSQPPCRQLWVPVKVGLKIRKVNMEVGLDPEDEETMEQHIFPSGMLQNIGPVDISKRLFKKLRECENARQGKLRVHDYGYDWRLSPHLLSRKLNEYLEKLPSNQPGTPAAQRGALVIAHSLGGLITRHAVNQRPGLFSGVVYAGVPQRCINILGPLRNGDAVLLNEKVLTAQVNFSLRTTFIFLPEDGFCFIDKVTKEEYPIDFYNADDWVKYRLSPCVSEPALPPLSRTSTFGSLLNLTESLPSLPLRSRSNSQQKKAPLDAAAHQHRMPEAIGREGHFTSPLVGGVSSAGGISSLSSTGASSTPASAAVSAAIPGGPGTAAQARYMQYLKRTLAEIKRFRSELAHNTEHQDANAYPPLAVIYTKDIPTVHAARVAGREGIACADAYDDLVFRSGDGVVLAREAMLPPGYELAKDGRICSDRGHISLLGDMSAVGRALEAVVRGRRKGIGMGAESAAGGKRTWAA
ncbi:hypothetical protein B0T26DRAFT_750203 [Lasiosphaeria miniovina]|uniref:Phosphatidylcholine-sterol O-acyltransferase-like protein n=1 Tax=Lasiosphaeria miniovina TaxID=1954250 RepID=A0AA40E2T0_9PEZI|nr:uncharacterized protein B0T26DRAFT_750203 [Lasiosphaeria miniovina]KAK0722857.1 hypothetical protein B0T26DRAFT_750203 [Lasiosphaeria miniovina]